VAEAAEVPEPVQEPVQEMVAVAEPEEMPLADDLTEETVAMAEVAPEVTAVESVAGGVMGLQEETAPTRNAPIFESVEPTLAVAEAEVQEQEVVVVKSTSGGRHWGVNVGDYSSRGDAERALLKTALAESATLNQGLRKITQKSGSYHANFMGLTEEQADLACRRLMARGVPCETLGPT
jgi:D-alanyl-D-alanine carboxypeptidase